MPKAVQDPSFQQISAQGQQIVTSSLVAGRGASVVGLADFGEPATAGSASEQTGQKVAGSACASVRLYTPS